MSLCQSTTEIFIAIFMAIVICGCKDHVKAPEYDNFRAEMTMQTVEDVSKGDTKKALETLDKFHKLAPVDPFPVAALRTEQIRNIVEQANQFLRQGSVNDLGLFLQNVEEKGNTSPEILAFRTVPPAIEALAQFCARMPWEKSADLAEGLELLKPHLDVLKSSETFNAFLTFQQSKYESMKQEEWLQENQASLERIDRAFVSGDDQTLQTAVSTLRKSFPQNPFFSCQDFNTAAEAASLAVEMQGKSGGREALEIAAALRWEKLSPSARRGVADTVGKNPRTFCGAWIAAMTGGHAPTASFFAKLQNAQLPPNRKIIASLLQLNASETVKNEGARRSPCPGIPDLISQYFSISVPQIKTVTNKKANK